MTAQTPFDFSHFLSKVLKNPQEINLIQANYQKNVALIKESIKIPKNLPSSQEISKFFVFLNEMQKTKKSVSLKSFFIKTKVFLIWLISVYELFSQKTLEIFQNEDWKTLAYFFPKIDFFKMKFRLFTYLKPNLQSRFWIPEQEELLTQTIRKMSPQLFTSNDPQAKTSWSKISFELSKGFEKLRFFKTDKQCKERWFNHLNPYLNKKNWSLQDDISLMRECLEKSKQWAKITRKFPGRTQHQIKNRYFALLTKELGLSREKIRDFTKRDCLYEVSIKALESLLGKNEKTEKSENESERIFEESSNDCTKENSNENSNESFYEEMEFNIDGFINFQREEQVFLDFP